MEDIYRKDPLDLIDSIAIRLELIEREVSELASRERAAGKMVAIAEQTEAIREALAVLRDKCRKLMSQSPCQP